MKDYAQEAWERGGKNGCALAQVEFCLEQLFADKVRTAEDTVAGYCSFEELIGALLNARDELKSLRQTASEFADLTSSDDFLLMHPGRNRVTLPG